MRPKGVRRAESRGRDAALKLVVMDAGEMDIPDRVRALIDKDTIVLLNKIDLHDTVPAIPVIETASAIIPISVKTGAGVGDVVACLETSVKARLSGHEGPVPTRQRHREALKETVAALERASSGVLPELVAEDIRLATRALGRITGRIDIDEILDTVFRDFCIGK